MVCVDTAPADNLSQTQQLVIGPAIIGQSAADAPAWLVPVSCSFFPSSPSMFIHRTATGLLSLVHHTYPRWLVEEPGQG